jgi:hypothetical protein
MYFVLMHDVSVFYCNQKNVSDTVFAPLNDQRSGGTVICVSETLFDAKVDHDSTSNMVVNIKEMALTQSKANKPQSSSKPTSTNKLKAKKKPKPKERLLTILQV